MVLLLLLLLLLPNDGGSGKWYTGARWQGQTDQYVTTALEKHIPATNIDKNGQTYALFQKLWFTGRPGNHVAQLARHLGHVAQLARHLGHVAQLARHDGYVAELARHDGHLAQLARHDTPAVPSGLRKEVSFFRLSGLDTSFCGPVP